MQRHDMTGIEDLHHDQCSAAEASKSRQAGIEGVTMTSKTYTMTSAPEASKQ